MSDLDPLAVLEAARSTLPFLPSTTPLDASMYEVGDPLPVPGTPGVAATLVGTTQVELMLVASDLVQEALAGAEGLTVADALRPALEAAAGLLGTGVLDNAAEVQVPGDLAADGWQIVTLTADGAVQGWFAVRTPQSPADAGAAGAAGGAGAPGATAGKQVTQAEATPEQRAHSMRLLYDVEMTLTAEIGRAKLPVHDVLDLTPGAVIELDRSAGAPADVMVNGRLIARGEIVVVDEEYGIRITEIVSLADQNQ